MELLLIILLFMVSVIVVAIRKDVENISRRAQTQAFKNLTSREPVARASKSKHQAISNRLNKE